MVTQTKERKFRVTINEADTATHQNLTRMPIVNSGEIKIDRISKFSKLFIVGVGWSVVQLELHAKTDDVLNISINVI